MPTRPDPEQSDEGPALEPIRVLRPRRTDALAELFKELERDRNGYEAVAVPPSLPGTEDATQELPPVAEETRIAPLGGGARPRPASSGGPGSRRAAVAVAVTAAAVVGFGGALLLSGRGDDAANGAQDPDPTASTSASAEPAPNAPGAPGADDSGGAGDSGGPGGSSVCTASFRAVNSWQGGYQGEVTVTNAPAASVSGWTATVVPDGGARLTQVWDGTLTTTRDGTATVANASWNGRLAPGASVTFGFIADTSQSGAPSAEVTCAATAEAS
ncbi:cellulose binding domain-containing protein [Streptomyces sp. AC550_RSS872]|uniref:cellulose binding domain-containing protein n=1 Tax=Streptomyces sp. AC550_RSS872 TaxID=2823689 RepID=UPI0027E577DB|nr:cellulose binding domain-containing protein [Streptomyces sp. AC550_RSS872]